MVLHPNPPPTLEEGISRRGAGSCARGWLYRLIWLVRECELVAVEVCGCFAALGQLAEQDLVCQLARDLVFDQASQWTRAEAGIVTVFREPLLCGRCYRQRDLLLVKTLLQLRDELVDHAYHRLRTERLKVNCRREPIGKFRRKHPLEPVLTNTLPQYA